MKGTNFPRLIRSVVLLLAVGASPANAQGAGGDACRYDDALQAWTSVLERFVDHQGRVDFEGVRADPGNLDAYLDCVAGYGPLSSPRDFETRAQRLAYYLNAYNALAMRKVIEFGIPDRITGLRKLRFFRLSRVRVSGERMSLYTLENDYIRSEGDPRIHFALNCMAASCPRLPREPFSASTLDRDLDQLTRKFFAERRNLRVEHEEQTVWATELLDFFPEDFLAEAPTLIDYVNRYIDPDIPPGYSVEFIDYDWSVNAQPR